MEVDYVKTLDHYVLEALDHIEPGTPDVSLPESEDTIVTGSQSGFFTGRIIHRFSGRTYVAEMEQQVQHQIDTRSELWEKRHVRGDVTIVSATGSRNVVPIAGYALDKGLPVNLVVCKPDSEMVRMFGRHVKEILIPAPEEPATINTASYGSMIHALAHKGKKEDVARIRGIVKSLPRPFGGYGCFNQYFWIFPDTMPEVADMVEWKMLAEIFGTDIGSISRYRTRLMHGAGIHDSPHKLYISVGVKDDIFGPPERRHHVELPDDLGPLGYLMVGYTIVGQMQRDMGDIRGYPFAERLPGYVQRARGWKWDSPIGPQS